MTKKALITGISGQDGSYLAEFLLEKGYEVHGLIRRSSTINTGRLDAIYESPQNSTRRFFLHYGDLTDFGNICELVFQIKPDEIYNLAAQSHVAVSFKSPIYTSEVNGLGAIKLLEAVRLSERSKSTRIYQASTSELFGLVQEIPQSETTPFYPRSPYAVAKLMAYWATINYREAYSIYACNGILFNHESPRRGETFVTRKITKGIADISQGLEKELFLGNLNAKRDWGHAKDYVEMQWLMLQQDTPEDYVIGSGVQHSVRQFVIWAAEAAGFEISFEGHGVEEVGIVTDIEERSLPLKKDQIVVRVDERYFRPAEVETLLSDASKAEKILGWTAKTKVKDLCREMVAYDIEQTKSKILSRTQSRE